MPLPTDVIKKYGLPRVTVYLDGLMFACFNQTEKLWEIAVLRETDKPHTLCLEAVPLDATGTPTGDPFTIDEIEGARRFTLAVEGSTGAPYKDFPEGYYYDKTKPEIDRLKDPDSPDYRWAINFVGSEPQHGNFVRLIPEGDGRVPVTMGKLPDALMFTQSVTARPVYFSDSPTTVDDNKRELGRINHWLGAAVFAPANAKAQIQIFIADDEPPVYDKTLPPAESYALILTNFDTPGATPESEGLYLGDFQLGYQIIETDGVKKYLWGVNNPTDPLGRGGVRGTMGACHPDDVDLPSLEDLMH